MQLISQRRKIQKNRSVLAVLDRATLVFAKRFLAISSALFCLMIVANTFGAHGYLLMMGLATLIILSSGLHGYLVLSFSNLYSRGSHRWRNSYLLAFGLNLVVWNVVLAVVLFATTVNHSIASMLLVLTGVLSLSMIKVFSPYGKVAKLLIALAFIPNFLMALNFPLLESMAQLMLDGVLLAGLFFLNSYLHELYWDKQCAVEELQNSSHDMEDSTSGQKLTNELHHEFIKNLSQELKTALNDNIGCLSLLKDTPMTKGQNELVLLAEQASERQLELINNVVDFNRISQKQIPLELTSFKIRRELEDIIQELSIDAANQSVEINTIINRNMPLRIKSDLGRVKQIIRALVNNIVRFSEQGSILIEADCINNGDGKGTLSIRVLDEGTGLQDTAKQDLFNAFVRIKHSQAGTGLGLAICKGLAECLDGEVGFENKEGRGKEIWLSLPVEVKSGQGENFVANPKLLDQRILLVDPPIKIQEHLIVEFESWGLKIKVIGGNRTVEKYLSQALEQDSPFTALLMFTRLKDDSVWRQGEDIARSREFSEIPQFIVANGTQIKNHLTRDRLLEFPQIHVITRPIQFETLHQLFVDVVLKQTRCVVSRGIIESSTMPAERGRILVVEDHRVNQMVAEGMLKKLHYSPKIASSGEEALKIIAEEKFDLILMDCQMAGIDGYQTTEAIRHEEEGSDRHIPIVALTAHTTEEDKSKCLAVGMDDYLSKPVRYDELESCLRRWIDTNNLLHNKETVEARKQI